MEILPPRRIDISPHSSFLKNPSTLEENDPKIAEGDFPKKTKKWAHFEYRCFQK